MPDVTEIGHRFKVERKVVTWSGDSSTARTLIVLSELSSSAEGEFIYAALLEDHEAHQLGHALLRHSRSEADREDGAPTDA
jgi:hypothetical protein